MKKSRYTLLLILPVVALAFFQMSSSEKQPTENGLDYEVNRIYPYIANTKTELGKAETLKDINRHFKPEWVREYLTVEITAFHNGVLKKVTAANHTLSQSQKDLISSADLGSDIEVNIEYIPENTLKNNDAKTINFTFKVEADQDAQFSGGEQEFQQYLKKAVAQIPSNQFEGYDLAVIKFIIDEKGKVTNAKVFWSSDDKKTDQLLLNAIQKMPKWTPAQYDNGSTVPQEFALAVGNLKSCVMNMIKSPVE